MWQRDTHAAINILGIFAAWLDGRPKPAAFRGPHEQQAVAAAQAAAAVAAAQQWWAGLAPHVQQAAVPAAQQVGQQPGVQAAAPLAAQEWWVGLGPQGQVALMGAHA